MIKKLCFIFVFSIFFLGCESLSKIEDFSRLNSINEFKDNKLYLVFYETNGCFYCVKQKKVFNKQKYTKKFPEISYHIVNQNEEIYNELIKIQGMENKNRYFPMMYIITKQDNKIKVLEEYTGFTTSEILDYTLIRNIKHWKTK